MVKSETVTVQGDTVPGLKYKLAISKRLIWENYALTAAHTCRTDRVAMERLEGQLKTNQNKAG